MEAVGHTAVGFLDPQEAGPGRLQTRHLQDQDPPLGT